MGDVTSVSGPTPTCWLGPFCHLGSMISPSVQLLSCPEGPSAVTRGVPHCKATDERFSWTAYHVSRRICA